MNRSARGGLAVAGLLAVLVVGACSRGSDPRGAQRPPSDLDSLAFHPESAQVRADIDSGNAQFLQAWKVGSADLFAQTFAEKGALTLKDGRVVQGQDSITALMGRVFAEKRMRHGTITTQAIRVDGDRAIETGRFLFEFVPVHGGGASRDSGAYAQEWKYEGGQWKMWRNSSARG